VQTRSSLFLVANLGSEVTRYIQAVKKGNDVYSRESLRRIEKIILEIVSLADMKSRKKEIENLRLFVQNISAGIIKCDEAEIESQAYFFPMANRFMSLNK